VDSFGESDRGSVRGREEELERAALDSMTWLEVEERLPAGACERRVDRRTRGPVQRVIGIEDTLHHPQGVSSSGVTTTGIMARPVRARMTPRYAVRLGRSSSKGTRLARSAGRTLPEKYEISVA
jgi:hypothetical protein